MKKEVFIEKAVAVHGDKYDYSLLPDEFKTTGKVPVVCKLHGEFYITSSNHIHNGRGCARCGFEYVSGLKKERSMAEFFEISPRLHNGKYDYSLVEYVDSGTKVKIICPVHGVFEQIPFSHVRGVGCFKCGREQSGAKQRDTTEGFIAKATAVHGNKYDYSKTNYINQQTKVKIICKEHGEFEQKPSNHLNGNDCPECMPQKLREMFMMPLEDFKLRLQNINPELTVDYGNYAGSMSMLDVHCSIHGNFKQSARNLILGHGCRKCGAAKSAAIRSRGNDYFIPMFKEVHGDTYDYSKSIFTNSKEKFTVICKQHGEFKTTASNHLKGKGCPKCGFWKSGYRSNKAGVFYILKVTDDVCKFGISNVFEQRFEQLSSKTTFNLEVMYLFEFQDGQIARNIESGIIESNIRRSVVNAADMKSGYTETFYLSDISRVLEIVERHKPA